ncbi:MAG: hypothetical protein HZA79_02765 [Sphingobacteriales bacterium]|nr:hypothetical protein [Sphingobacteriales bacterium]
MIRKVSTGLLTCIYLLASKGNISGQSSTDNPVNKVTISSPNAAALGKYGDYTVGYQTGTPNISIPVYTISEGPLSMSVGLSYHASGLKVMEPSSWVGAGWSLSAGGMITRTVRGNVDERGFGNSSTQSHGYFSDYGYNNYLFIADDGGNGCSAATQPNNMKADDPNFSNGKKDGEPDLFTFNFGSYSGKFFFNDDRTPIIVPEQDIKIEPIIAPNSLPIIGFKITTPDGTKYYFGKNQTPGNGGVDATEITNSYDSEANLSYGGAYSSWFLVKVESADGLFNILLKYEQENYSNYTISMRPLDENEQIKKEYTLVKNYISGVRLAKISTINREIVFMPGDLRQDLSNYNPSYNSITDGANTEARTLGEVKIQAPGGGNCKKFKFYYSYFDDNVTPFPAGFFVTATSSDKKRLRLDKIQEYTCDETQNLPPYLFNYYAEQVPRQISFAQDHWGYYNGQTGNTTLIPTYTVDTYNYKFGADRESKWPEMRGGTLNKITYPTGGSTDFEFEANTTWVNAAVQTLVNRGNYSVGYDGNGHAYYPNLNFSSNHYRVTLTNNNCLPGYTCNAAVYLESNDGSISYAQIIWTPGGSSATGVVVAPSPGLYRLHLVRDNTIQSGSGATAVLEEIVPSTLSSNVTVGGLRIKKITTHDGVSAANDLVTHYSYNDANNKSNGVLYSKPVYVSVIRNDILKTVGMINDQTTTCSPNGCVTCISPTLFKSASSIRPMETLQGGHIGYNEVKVSQSGKGSSIYRFYGSDIWDINTNDVCTRNVNISCDLSVPNYPSAPLPFEYMRGEQKYEAHFNENGQLLKYSWFYPVFTDNLLKTPGTIRGALAPNASITNYEISTKRKTQVTVDETIMNLQTGTGLTTSNTTYFESLFHRQPTRVTSTNSKGEITETKYKYAFDFRTPSCDVMPDCWQNYQNAVTVATNTFNGLLNTCVNNPSSCNCRWVAFQQYRRDLSIARINYLACESANRSSYTTCFGNAKNTANTDLKPILELQSRNMNVPLETTSWRNGKLLAAAFTKYDFSPSVPGMVYPVKSQKITLSAPSSIFTTATVSGDGLTKDSRYEDESSYTLENGNLVEMTGKDGIVTSYLWGYNNTLPIAKAVGVSYITLSAAYAAVGQNLSLLRTYPTLSNALVSTYVYTLGLGMINETDSRGRITYYEYDNLHRLVLVRDNENQIIKKICYNYAGQPETCIPQVVYYNTERSQVFTRNNCGTCSQGSQVTYTVPANTYSSTVSPQAANQLAQNDIDANGQNYANANGTCSSSGGIITYDNQSFLSGFTATYTNTSTGQVYTFSIPASGIGTLGCLPVGGYSLTISKPGNNIYLLFGTGCFTQSGTSATFARVNSNACNQVTLQNAQ